MLNSLMILYICFDFVVGELNIASYDLETSIYNLSQLSLNINITKKIPYNNNWPVLTLSVFSVMGIFGNLLVCLAIKRDHALQTSVSYYLFSLAIADLAVCLIVIPLSLIQDFKNEWTFGFFICTFWIFSDILTCNSSIFHLCTVSILRWIAIQFPLKASQTKSIRITCIIIIFIWVTSFLISFPIVLLGLNDLTNVMDLNNKRCILLNTSFRLYGSFFSFVIPLLIMIIMYTLMVRKLRQELNMKGPKLSVKKSVSESVGVNYIRNVSNFSISKHFLSSEVIYFSNGGCTVKIERPEIFSPRKNNLSSSSCDFAKRDINEKNTLNLKTEQFIRAKSLSTPLDSSTQQNYEEICQEKDDLKKISTSIRNLENSAKKKPSLLSISSSNDLNSKLGLIKNGLIVKSTSENQNESKALQVLGVVFIVFIITWLPFCFLNMLSTVLEMNNQSTAQFNSLVVYFTYLGYFQSTLNPIIYTIFNKKFRKNFQEIIKCERKTLLNSKNGYLKSYRSCRLKKRNSSLLIKRV